MHAQRILRTVCIWLMAQNVHGLSCPTPIGNSVTYPDLNVVMPISKLETSYDAKGLQPFFNLANSFVNTVQPNSLTKEFRNIKSDSLQSILSNEQVKKFETPIIVCAAFGILFAVLMPLVGLIFCCCRCCGKCGGKMYQDAKAAEQHTKCCIFSLILLTTTILMLCGVLFMFVVNNNLHTSLQKAGPTFNQVIDDGFAVANASVQAVDAITSEQIPCAVKLVRDDLSDESIRTRIGDPLRDAVAGKVIAVINQVVILSNTLDVINAALIKVNGSTTACRSLANDLDAELNKGESKLNQTISDCKADAAAAATGKCSELEKIVIGTSLDLSSLPDIKDQIEKIQSAVNQNFKQAALDAKKMVDDIPSTVVNQTSATRANLLKTIDDAQKTVNTKVGDIKQEVDKNILAKRSEFSGYEKYVDVNGDYFKYEKYRWQALMGVAGIVALFVVLLFLGLILGSFGYKRNVVPSNRSGVATCGGHCLMAAVGLMFIFSAFLMLICTIWCVVGIHQHVLCRELKDAEILDTFINGKLQVNGQIIKVKETLDNCRKNQAVFKALGGERIFNLTEKLSLRENTKEIDAEIDKLNISLTDRKVLTSDVEKSLNDLINSGVESIAYSDFLTKLSQNMTDMSLSDVVANLESIATAMDVGATAFANRVRGLKNDVINIQNGILKHLQENITQLKADVLHLQSLGSRLKGDVQNLLANVTAADLYIQVETMGIIKQIIKDFSNRVLGWLDQLTSHLIKQVQTNMLKCKPIADLYDGVHTYLCGNVGQNANGYWCALGWCLLFFIPAIIFSVKLAKFYRRMEYDSGHDSDISYPPYNDKIPLQQRQPGYNSHSSRSDNDAPPPYTNTGYTQY